jgi:hypothetical protein
MNCKNCNNEINNNYCPNCGQPAHLKRIDGHYIQHEIEHVLHFDKGILYTVKELFVRPGQNIKEYISENRNKLVKPIIFIIVTSLIYTLVTHFFHVEDSYVKHENSKVTSTSLIFEWIQGHYGYANIIMGVFIALCIKLFFRKHAYNFFEIIILLCFVMGVGMLIFTLFALLQGLLKIEFMQIAAVVSLIYCSWAIGQFFDKRKKINYLKAFLAYLLGYMFFNISALGLGMIIDSVVKH